MLVKGYRYFMESTKELLHYTKHLNLLYVEDSNTIRKMFYIMLEPLFKTVYLAENGKDGLDVFNNNSIDIVITDIEMPILDGLRMSRSIRQIDPDIPIVLTTGHLENSIFLKSIEMGIDAYLPKPVDHMLLKHTLFRLCKTIIANKNQKEESRYFEILTEASIVSKSDINGIITYVNDNLCDISGYSRDELMGHSHNIFRHPSTEDSKYKDMWSTILAGKVWQGRMENVKKNGESFLSETIIIPLINNKGYIQEFISLRQDITEYVMLQRQLFQDNQKKEEQKQINEAKEAFLILFTHELKTPLNAIINFAKYLKNKSERSEEVEPSKVQKLLHSILNNGMEMLANINSILDISKLKAGKLNYSKQLFNLKDMLREILQQYDSLIIEKSISVECLIDKDINIYSDEYRIKQVVSNVISNSIKYGKDKIIIKAFQSESVSELLIEDNGPGIKDKEAVFNLYNQGEGSVLNHSINGTGVGLHFVKLLCDDLNVSYRIEDSTELSGIKFILSFENKRINNKRINNKGNK